MELPCEQRAIGIATSAHQLGQVACLAAGRRTQLESGPARRWACEQPDTLRADVLPMHMHMHMPKHRHTHMHMHMPRHKHTHMHTHRHMPMPMHTHMHTHTHMHNMHVHMHMHECMCECMCMHMHTCSPARCRRGDRGGRGDDVRPGQVVA